jgi:hypothetical protein
MLKKLHLVIVLAAGLGLLAIVVVMSQAMETEGLTIRGKEIRIHGQDYTLAKIAEEVNDPALFRYDPKERRALAAMSLIVRGGLQIGDPADPKLGETLVLDTVVCGDLRIEVERGGALRVHHSTVTTKSETLTVDQCSQGYALIVDGEMDAADSFFLYMSGSRSETARRRARVRLERVTFAQTDGSAFHTVRADGARLDIRDSKFLCEGFFGVVVEGGGGEPVRLENCQLYGRMADLALTGARPVAELVDCQFARGKVKFFQGSGRARVRWTVHVKVVEKGTDEPIPGIDITATSEDGTEVAEATTDESGIAALLLTEYEATADLATRLDGKNTVTPHHLVARRGGETLAEKSGYDANLAGDEVVLEVAPQALAAAP